MFEIITRSNYRFDSTDDYYFDHSSGDSLLLYERDKKHVRFFSPNSFTCLQCTESAFRKMVKNKTLEKSKYLLDCSYFEYGFSHPDRGCYATNDLNKVYGKLNGIVKAFVSRDITLDICYVKDLETKNQILVARTLPEMETAVQQYRQAQKNILPPIKKTFQPSKINIQNLLACIGLKKRPPETLSDNKAKTKGR